MFVCVFFFLFSYVSLCLFVKCVEYVQVLEAIGRSPFLVGMHYAFQTESKLYLILGTYNVENKTLLHLANTD